MRHFTIPLFAAALMFGACGESKTEPAGNNGSASTVSPVKADCPDCDPAGPGAFVQTGIGSGFYELGTTWQVAYRPNPTPNAEKHDETFLGTYTGGSDVYLFDYAVLHVDKAIFANVLRDTVRIEITQAIPSGPHAGLFSVERLDRHEKRVIFEMNDLLDPISETIFSVDYPHGRQIELDSTASLKTGASIFPRTIPRVLVANQINAPAPDMPDDLAAVVDAMDAGWRDRQYIKVTFDNDDVAYWAVGEGWLWPFYVETEQGVAALVSWN